MSVTKTKHVFNNWGNMLYDMVMDQVGRALRVGIVLPPFCTIPFLNDT